MFEISKNKKKTAIKMKRQDSLNGISTTTKIPPVFMLLCRYYAAVLFEYDTEQVTMINSGH